MTEQLPKSRMEAVLYFTPARCAEYMVGVKWPDRKIKCPACGNESCKQLATRPVIKCNRKVCQKQTSLKVGTIFEDSKLGLDKWFVAVWSVANAKNGISSHELGRAIKVTQQTAWFMEMRIREAMKSGTFTKLMGPVESDETFVGGKDRNRHWNKKSGGSGGIGSGKVGVIGAISRKGNVVCRLIENTDERTLTGFVEATVSEQVRLIATDEHSGYGSLAEGGYRHQVVRHGRDEYVRGMVHTNSMESFWSLLKRGVMGTYHNVSRKYLPLYLNEFTFRHNNRKNADMFGAAVASC